jgi:cholesterol transport system auxiliary component
MKQLTPFQDAHTTRPLLKLAEENTFRGEAGRRTGVYTLVNEDSSTASTKQIISSVAFPKRSIGCTHYFIRMITLFTIPLLLNACGPVKSPTVHQYTLDAYSHQRMTNHPAKTCLLVTPPTATAGYETAAMQYMSASHTLGTFSQNAWIGPPANMLYPLLLQSLQASGSFHTVVSDLYSEQADYRLDTQLLTLRQNFLTKPSRLELTAKLTLTALSDNQPLASKIISIQIPCTADTPYGGVLAANQATTALTKAAVHFSMRRQ